MLAIKFHACNYFAMSAKLLLIEARLGGRRLPDLVGRRRAQGKSWQGIANEIHDMTGVAVSRESLRAWCNQSKAVAS